MSCQKQRGGGLSPARLWTDLGEAILNKLSSEHYEGNLDAVNRLEDLPFFFAPTRRGQKKKDYKYLEWVVRSYLQGGIIDYSDIQSLVYPALDDFNLLLSKKVLKPEEQDILKYCGLTGCIKNKRQYPGLAGLLEQYRDDLYDHTHLEPVVDGPHSKVYKPLTIEQSQKYGAGTKWCTAGKIYSRFHDYIKEGPLYIIIPKVPAYPGEKYQFHPSTASFKDDRDEQPKRIKEIMARFPEIAQATAPPPVSPYGMVVDFGPTFTISYYKKGARPEGILYDADISHEGHLYNTNFSDILSMDEGGDVSTVLHWISQNIICVVHEHLSIFLLNGFMNLLLRHRIEPKPASPYTYTWAKVLYKRANMTLYLIITKGAAREALFFLVDRSREAMYASSLDCKRFRTVTEAYSISSNNVGSTFYDSLADIQLDEVEKPFGKAIETALAKPLTQAELERSYLAFTIVAN